MLDSIEYATLLQYSPRGTSETCAKSRKVKDSIKAGRIENFRSRLSQIIAENKDELQPFLHDEITLVPMPRSSPTRESDLWPALEIAKMVASLHFGTVASCLIRTAAIRKSSLYYNADQRPSIAEQYESMAVKNYVPTANITLIDDVLTMGRTSLAAASRLAEKFPNATIRLFCLIQTRGFDADLESILKVRTGNITYYESSGKCTRIP